MTNVNSTVNACTLALVSALALTERSSHGQSCGTIWTRMTPAASTACAPPRGPAARQGAAVAFDAHRGVLVLFGGEGPSGTFNGDTWEWDGATWTRRCTGASPAARYFHTMAFDAVRGRVVLFGGWSGSCFLNDLWEWDGQNGTWVALCGVACGGCPGPAARQSHGMAYDVARGKVVVFGGWNGTPLGDTWEWDSHSLSWAERFPGAPPAARHTHAMAYDAARGVTVLYGGAHTGGHAAGLADTWEWDGGAWTQGCGTCPPGERIYLAMASHPACGAVVLFGGVRGSGSFGCELYGDAWTWDGVAWTLAAASGPAPRTVPAMAGDPARAEIVVFAGNTCATGYQADTWVLGDPDGDGDGVPDADERSRHGTDEFDADTDDDGLGDGDEVALAFAGCPDPLAFDSDGDLLSDGAEILLGLDPCDMDVDDDGLADGRETGAGADPQDPDSDGDGLLDGTEVDLAEGGGCPDPLSADSDGDALHDGAEAGLGTDPCRGDTDGDGVSDGEDDLPTQPGVTGGFIEQALRSLCESVHGMPLQVFDAPNVNARSGRRNALCNKLIAAANLVASADYADAKDKIEHDLQPKLDGEAIPPDWMIEGAEEKDSLRTELEELSFLLSFLS
jgi:hypothetical protein